MSALLQILSNFLSLIKDLPLKNKMIILVMLIILGGGYLFYDRYLDYKLATFEKPSPSTVTEKISVTSHKVARITSKTEKITAQGVLE